MQETKSFKIISMANSVRNLMTPTPQKNRGLTNKARQLSIVKHTLDKKYDT